MSEKKEIMDGKKDAFHSVRGTQRRVPFMQTKEKSDTGFLEKKWPQEQTENDNHF